MLVALSATTYDPGGYILLDADRISTSGLNELTRRVSRTATLDGGCAIYDTGLSHADRTFSLVAQVTETEESTLRRLQEYYSLIGVAVPDGFYRGVIERLVCKNGTATIKILVKEKLSE